MKILGNILKYFGLFLFIVAIFTIFNFLLSGANYSLSYLIGYTLGSLTMPVIFFLIGTLILKKAK